MKRDISEMKRDYMNIEVPAEAKARILKGIEEANREEKEKSKVVKFPAWGKVAVGVAAAFAICFISVNSSDQAAMAAAKVPVFGEFFKVITLRSVDEGNLTANIPGVSGEGLAKDEVNAQAKAYIETLINSFREDTKDGEFSSRDIDYRVLTDNDRYFAMDVFTTDTQAGGYEYHRFYTIDKADDRVLSLKDIYGDRDYVKELSAEILRQMQERDTEYFIGEDGFTSIKPDQNFYINDEGKVVICFDEYEVAPGALGAVEFIIP